MRRSARAFLCTLAFFAFARLQAQPHETGFLNRTVSVAGIAYRYQVYVPADWSADKKWPFVLFLHGAGERGDDGLAQTQVGIAAALRLHADRYPAIVVMPQCRKDVWWQDPAMEAQALAALDQSVKEFRTDPERVYLTGLSMGGYGSWAWLQKYPGKFAAAAVICGGIVRPRRPGVPEDASADPNADAYAEAAKKIGNIQPIWIFHGGADPVVPVGESRKMLDALKTLGSHVKYTEYEGVGHNSWDKAYAEPELPTWMFSHSLNAQKNATR
jgi:predicted peptidase